MNILYFFPRALYEHKMSPGRVQYGEAVARQPGVDLKVWGPGWDGWDDTLTVAANCGKQFGAGWLDTLWSYKASDHQPGAGTGWRRSIVCFNEANDQSKTMPDIKSSAATDVIFHHENDWRLWAPLLTAAGVRSHRLMHCVDPNYFRVVDRPESIAMRPIPSIVSGVQAPRIYPLRARFAKFIDEGRFPGRVRKHPGYRLFDLKSCQSQYRDYTRQLSLSHVSLCCTSKHRYALAKIIESLAAGCVTVTDFPEDGRWIRDLGQFCVRVADTETDESLISYVANAIEKGQYVDRAAAGQKWVLENLTTDHYARDFLACLQ